MLGRIRNSIWFALFLCILGGYLFAAYQASNPQKDQNPPRVENGKKPDSDKSDAGNHKHASSRVQIECDPTCSAKNGDEHRNQSRIARFINKTTDDPVAVFTAVGAFATTFLFIGVLLQLKDARLSSERQLRAYVMIQTVRLENFSVGGTPEVRLVFKNFGKTPATNLTHWARLGFNTFPEITGELHFTRGYEELPPSPLAPGGKVHLVTGIDKPLDWSTVNAVIEKTYAFYVIGEIRYVDAFGTTRETDFLLFSTGSFATEGSMANYKIGNRIT